MIRRALSIAAAAALACFWLTLASWLLAITLSDRTLWSQYNAWIPREVHAIAASAALIVSRTLRALARRAGPRTPPTTTQRARHRALLGSLAPIALAALLLHLTLVHWRLHNALTRAARNASSPSLRIVSWNATNVWERHHGSLIAPAFADADVIVFANPMSYIDWNAVAREWGEWDENAGRYRRPFFSARDANFLIFSRWPIARWGSLTLNIPGAGPDLDDPTGLARPTPDPGTAMWFELAPPEDSGFSRPIVAWAIDLPSDVRLSRTMITEHAAATIRAWTGPERRRDESGQVVTQPTSPSPASGFPAPDLIMGDFNIPRGCASLRTLTHGLESAFDQAGIGRAATWPARNFRTPVPIFHLDQMFVGAALRAARYEILDPKTGLHKAQRAELVPAASQAPTPSHSR